MVKITVVKVTMTLKKDTEDAYEEDYDSDCEDSGSEEDHDSDEEMDVDIPTIPSYTLHPGSSAAITSSSHPIDISLLVDGSMMADVVEQKNLLAQQYMASNTLTPHSRIRRWMREEHNLPNLQRFLALILVMGIVHHPQLESYWSTSWSYATEAFSSVSLLLECFSNTMMV